MPLDAHVALLNWGLWARSPIVDLDIPEPPIFANWIPSKGWDAGWGDCESTPPPAPMPVDEQEAIAIDRLLLRLALEHWRTIYRRYYQLRPVPELELGAAHRALSDLMEEKRLDTAVGFK